MAASHRTRAGEAGCSLGRRKPSLGTSPAGALCPPWGKENGLPVWALPALTMVPRGLGHPGLTELEGPLPMTLFGAAQGVDKDQQHHLGPTPGSL